MIVNIVSLLFVRKNKISFKQEQQKQKSYDDCFN